MRISYLSDALGDLAKAVVSLLKGADEAATFFMDEPGEHLWVMQRHGELLQIQIQWFDDWLSWGLVTPETGQTVFEAETSLIDFARQLKSQLDALLERHGIEGYAQLWCEHEFPMPEYQQLEKLLALPGEYH